jgi:hypothetical protein
LGQQGCVIEEMTGAASLGFQIATVVAAYWRKQW